ncbi:MAG: penicillin-binding protein 2, penicillin-binding protein 2 [Candidatus Taylorbacteria bacterium]|nr:penicillin-binding protein 2, penicillin-binding protein 2 [Candidatus Taylorbacteria bacterium]
MFHRLFRKLKKRQSGSKKSVNPDEIFLDSSNLPSFNRDQFEGRIETPISKFSLGSLKYIFILIAIFFIYRALNLQIINSDFYVARATNNNLQKEVIFAHRGIVADRNDKNIAWNEEKDGDEFDKRAYLTGSGLSHLLGYVKYPGQDSKGHFYSFSILGQDGIEKYFDDKLAGVNGAKLTEVSVKGAVESQSTLEPPQNGEKINLSIDADVNAELYKQIASAVEKSGFSGGAGIIMDAHTGEVLATASYPDYDSNVMTDGSDKAKINEYLNSKKQPFLDRVVSGLYAPGSIVKPFIALGILQENIIDPLKQILTHGFISLPNPYDPEHPSVFKDWKNQGSVDLRKAIAVSSDVYFYITGGGYEGQKGLGITKMDEYISKFLFGVATNDFFGASAGTIPTPQWKKDTFKGEDWRVGDTYHTTIGQYGWQVTPLQVVRAMSGIATEGTIVEPTIIKDEQGKTTPITGIDAKNYKIVKEGMRMAVTEQTAIALNIPGIQIAAKTGTAELGTAKAKVNSWVEGFFPYDNPKYVFALVLENGPTTYKVSAMRAMSDTLSAVRDNQPEYVK